MKIQTLTLTEWRNKSKEFQGQQNAVINALWRRK